VKSLLKVVSLGRDQIREEAKEGKRLKDHYNNLSELKGTVRPTKGRRLWREGVG